MQDNNKVFVTGEGRLMLNQFVLGFMPKFSSSISSYLSDICAQEQVNIVGKGGNVSSE